MLFRPGSTILSLSSGLCLCKGLLTGLGGGSYSKDPSRNTNWRPQRGRDSSRAAWHLRDPHFTLTTQIRTLRLKILAQAAAEGVPVRGARNQLRMYLTMAVAAAQPVLMYWLTFHLVR